MALDLSKQHRFAADILRRLVLAGAVVGLLGSFAASSLSAQDKPIPHNQSAPPNDPYTAEEAAARMTVPEGFTVEVVAAEPELVNPVAMAFDHRGRIWVVESLEYPRLSAGPGRDRIKILEDTDADGRVDSVKVFAEGLNIPSGIAIGHGGVWVANSPDILFLKDTDGDDRADESEVIVTGFGRHDTHELPNSLTWGPDGFLYGLNGVFNFSHVEQGDRTWDFTCAMFRIDPRTRKFELFAEGTSNPWGIAWNSEGQAFLSACVIDHLWHLNESGYYHRQAGAYPPYTWKIESIVEHRHQKAAYCGITYFDSPAYPEEYRGRLYMGNIHGNCINVDSLTRNGATYRGHGEDDFLSANDAWFMPVAQKTGPDGCLYVLDWYDRYHCYQDARRDPAGIDRLKGRLYRVRYQDTPRQVGFDLSKKSDAELTELLGHANVYYRRQAQRLLGERCLTQNKALMGFVSDVGQPTLARRHGLWALISGLPLSASELLTLLADEDPVIRGFAIRAAGNQRMVDRQVVEKIGSLAADPVPDVRLQVAIAMPKLAGLESLVPLLDVLRESEADGMTPRIVWGQLLQLLKTEPTAPKRLLEQLDLQQWAGNANGLACLNRAFEWILENASQDREVLVACLTKLQASGQEGVLLQSALRQLIEIAQLTSDEKFEQGWGADLLEILDEHSQDKKTEVYLQACRAMLGDRAALEQALEAKVTSSDPDIRNWALLAVQRWNRPEALKVAATYLAVPPLSEIDESTQRQWLAWLSRFSEPEVGQALVTSWPRWAGNVKPGVIESLSSRATWAKLLLGAIENGEIPQSALNVNQVRKMLTLNDDALTDRITAVWGTVRTDRNPDREQLIRTMRARLTEQPGDPERGMVVFQRVCGQCHKLYGVGNEVGPELTGNGRGTFDQLLSNVFDPSLVIGAAYQATLIETVDGRVETGLVIEDQPGRVVLRIQGGKEVTIPRADIEAIQKSPLSLMPENLEENVTPDEMRDLFALLMLDQPGTDPGARWIPGILPERMRNFEKPADFQQALQWNLPGFALEKSGENGVGLLDQHFGRSLVVRTHPVSKSEPCRVSRQVELKPGHQATLYLSVSHDEHNGDWQLIVKANGKTLHDQIVGPQTTQNGWLDLEVDLSRFAGQSVQLELLNAANDWSYEFAYFGRVFVVEDTAAISLEGDGASTSSAAVIQTLFPSLSNTRFSD